MTEEPSSAYRDAPKAELVVQGGFSSMRLVWVAAVGVGLKAAWWYFDLPAVLGWFLAMGLLVALVPLAIWAERRNRWRFTLERSTLRVERLLPGGVRRIGALDVHQGLRLRVDVPEQVGGEAPRFILDAQGEELSFSPGGTSREIYGELTRFLRDHDVEVDASAELPELEEHELKLPKL